MTSSTTTPPPSPTLVSPAAPASGVGKWMALIAALLGWTFDGFEMGMFPLVGQPALMELLPGASKTVVDQWFGVIMAVFLVGAATGGVLFGWLGDRIGRVRAMALSIFTYAIFTGLAGFATEAWHIAATRFIASLGMGGEWSLGVALVIEIWPDRSRAFLAGLIGAAANVGFMLVGIVSLGVLAMADDVPGWLTAVGIGETYANRVVSNDAWRLMMMLGALPAVLIFLIRLFVPESAKWEEQKEKGATSFWATRDLLAVAAGSLATMAVVYVWSPMVNHQLSEAGVSAARWIVTPLGIGAALIGYIYPVLQYLRRAKAAGGEEPGGTRRTVGLLMLGAVLSGVALLGTWGALQWAAKWSLTLPGAGDTTKEYTQISLSIGAIVGTIIAALVAGRFGRRITYAGLCVLSTASLLFLYQANDEYNWMFLVSVFVAGGVTAAFYGWFPLYLPELFGTRIRATSQGFAYNFGRVIAAIAGLQTAQVMMLFDGDFAKAGSVLCFIYVIGLFVIWLGPETRGKPLPE